MVARVGAVVAGSCCAYWGGVVSCREHGSVGIRGGWDDGRSLADSFCFLGTAYAGAGHIVCCPIPMAGPCLSWACFSCLFFFSFWFVLLYSTRYVFCV
jgi:hypothetical protein